MSKIFCAKCGYPFYKRIYSNGNRLNWGCSGRNRYGTDFCEGINVPDSIIRAWEFTDNIYIRELDTDKGMKQFTYTKEQSWKRRHKKKEHKAKLPKLTERNYPYMKNLFCGCCGKSLGRSYNTKNGMVFWQCNTWKRKGKAVCEGVRVPDEVVRGWGDVRTPIFIKRKDGKDGEKRYSYTCKKPSGSTQEC